MHGHHLPALGVAFLVLPQKVRDVTAHVVIIITVRVGIVHEIIIIITGITFIAVVTAIRIIPIDFCIDLLIEILYELWRFLRSEKIRFRFPFYITAIVVAIIIEQSSGGRGLIGRSGFRLIISCSYLSPLEILRSNIRSTQLL